MSTKPVSARLKRSTPEYSGPRRADVRNVAIIAHVDHGKTTLVDGLLTQGGFFRANQQVVDCFMDSMDLERERGITIRSKLVSFDYQGVKINLIDTPGHADFGGEVERVLGMADGVLLLVDAFDGPMPQTRFVLSKALAHGLFPVVVVNKIDRPEARPYVVLDEVFDLFVSLGASDRQLDFTTIYASGRERYAVTDLKHERKDLGPLYDALLHKIPGPPARPDESLAIQFATIQYDDYVGRIGVGRVHAGTIRARQRVARMHGDETLEHTEVKELYVYRGLKREPVAEASAGDIVAVSGIEDLALGDTLTDPERPNPLPPVAVEQPTLSMNFRVNDSPFSGREGKAITTRILRERLDREARGDPALRVDEVPNSNDFKVSGRGLLHLGILIENMRREGLEFAVARPQVILREEEGRVLEPYEFAVIDVPEAYSGKVMEVMGERQAEMLSIANKTGIQHYEFRIPSRALIGLRTRLLNATRGEAILHHIFLEYGERKAPLPERPVGVLVSMATGSATAYSLDALAPRGVLFVEPGEEVYQGMVVGEHSREDDLDVNPVKAKHLTNIRAASKDKGIILAPPRRMSIEDCLEYLAEDELLEVTPKGWRIRKFALDAGMRQRARRDAKREDQA